MKHPRLGWVELGGAGIFRPEVTLPHGVTSPVIAWGLGLDRMAMVALGIADIREASRTTSRTASRPCATGSRAESPRGTSRAHDRHCPRRPLPARQGRPHGRRDREGAPARQGRAQAEGLEAPRRAPRRAPGHEPPRYLVRRGRGAPDPPVALQGGALEEGLRLPREGRRARPGHDRGRPERHEGPALRRRLHGERLEGHGPRAQGLHRRPGDALPELRQKARHRRDRDLRRLADPVARALRGGRPRRP